MAMKVILYDPVSLELGFQEKSPVVGSKVAPVGKPVAESATVPPGLTEAAETVKLIQAPAVTVRLAGTVSIGGTKASTLTVTLFETVA